jgi:hypothetical protein
MGSQVHPGSSVPVGDLTAEAPTGEAPTRRNWVTGQSRIWWPRLRPWIISRVLVLTAIMLLSFVVSMDPYGFFHHPHHGWTALFSDWDTQHFLTIARHGYFPGRRTCCEQAFFPGYPMAMKGLGWLLGAHYIEAGLIIALVASLVAAALLWVLAADWGGEAAGDLAVVILALHPYALFFNTAYTDAPFLAFALAAWWAGRRGRWWLAGLFAAGATSIRINGVFVAAGLAVMLLEQLIKRRPGMRWWHALSLLSPAVVVGAFFTWLWAHTGSWTAWQDAQLAGWRRTTTTPWVGLMLGWQKITASQDLPHRLLNLANLAIVVLALVLTAWLVIQRSWPEACYLGLSVGVVVCSNRLMSVTRFSLTWFPILLILAQTLAPPERRWHRRALAVLVGPVAAYNVYLFAKGSWLG